MYINHIPWEIRNPQFSLMLIVFCLTATNSQALPALAFCLDYLLKLMGGRGTSCSFDFNATASNSEGGY